KAARSQPVSPYGVTKLAGEQLCFLYHVNHGVPMVALRLFTVYGPRQRPDMGFHRFLTAPPPLGGGPPPQAGTGPEPGTSFRGARRARGPASAPSRESPDASITTAVA